MNTPQNTVSLPPEVDSDGENGGGARGDLGDVTDVAEVNQLEAYGDNILLHIR